ncbi:hypothetical protein TNCV_1970721 [Trichonephila clavipes]|uniref:Uncharacterized protein n=1 Tax=Trichonephila clavipes TaxID=2585209 RepID=A0A8X6W507_TRICX|nr:hypothetical protein TNCV_1970721 [Trichonephila clavipes]
MYLKVRSLKAYYDLKKEKKERELMTNQQESCSLDCNPGVESHTLDSTESGSLIDPMQNPVIKELDNDNEESFNSTRHSKVSSSCEKFSSEKHILKYRKINKLTDIIHDELSSTNGLLENLALDKVNLMKSDMEFALKFTECERIRSLNTLIRKAIMRCRTLAISHLDDILRSVKSHSSTMDSEKRDSIAKCMRLNFDSRNFIGSLMLLMYKNKEHLDTYSTKLDEEKSLRMGPKKGKKGKKKNVTLLEARKDLVTQSDHDIATTLTTLINSSEKFLLPMLHEQGLLCENLPVKTYSCEDTPESIRNHMAILEEMLSDSNDLLNFFMHVYPISIRFCLKPWSGRRIASMCATN